MTNTTLSTQPHNTQDPNVPYLRSPVPNQQMPSTHAAVVATEKTTISTLECNVILSTSQPPHDITSPNGILDGEEVHEDGGDVHFDDGEVVAVDDLKGSEEIASPSPRETPFWVGQRFPTTELFDAEMLTFSCNMQYKLL